MSHVLLMPPTGNAQPRSSHIRSAAVLNESDAARRPSAACSLPRDACQSGDLAGHVCLIGVAGRVRQGGQVEPVWRGPRQPHQPLEAHALQRLGAVADGGADAPQQVALLRPSASASAWTVRAAVNQRSWPRPAGQEALASGRRATKTCSSAASLASRLPWPLPCSASRWLRDPRDPGAGSKGRAARWPGRPAGCWPSPAGVADADHVRAGRQTGQQRSRHGADYRVPRLLIQTTSMQPSGTMRGRAPAVSAPVVWVQVQIRYSASAAGGGSSGSRTPRPGRGQQPEERRPRRPPPCLRPAAQTVMGRNCGRRCSKAVMSAACWRVSPMASSPFSMQ